MKTTEEKTAMVLAGDIGGTKTSLALFAAESGIEAPVEEATFSSGDYPCLEVLVQEFLVRTGTTVHVASFGVAGPVVEGRAKITNLPWIMDEARLTNALGMASVHLLNDLVALAHAVPFLTDGDLHVLNTGRAVPGGSMAVVAPGTGLGEAYLTWDGSAYRPQPSEGGHADFGPSNALETGLLHYLLERFDHVSYERICSGMGLVNIYAYLKDSGYAEEPEWLAEQMASARDRTPVIIEGAFDEGRPWRTVYNHPRHVSLHSGGRGREHGLEGDGIRRGLPWRRHPAPAFFSALESGPFMDAFRRKGRMSTLMEDMPVYVILNPKAALMGAARHGMDEGTTKRERR